MHDQGSAVAPMARRVEETGGAPVERAARAAQLISQHADDVDLTGRFPDQSVDALRAERLLSLLVPLHLGGEEAPLQEVARVTTRLASACASTAMIFAMHQIQVACLVGHGNDLVHHGILRRAVDDQLLFASATTETGVGGDVRTSLCAIEQGPHGATLSKQAPVISYGDAADAVLATARRDPDSPPSDQVLVCCERSSTTLERTSEWDALGFRGTASCGYALRWDGSPDAILTDPYSEISAQTMLPVSHVLWSAVWLGIAEEAARRAHAYVRAQTRPDSPTSAAGTRLAELIPILQQFRSSVGRAAESVASTDAEGRERIAFAVSMNSLKVSSSTTVVDIVGRALAICGMAGYRMSSPYSLGRLLRDAHGAAVMINNDRITANTAHLLLATKEL